MMTLQEAKNNVATNLPVPISEPDHLKPFSNWDDLQICYHLHYEVKGLIKLTDLAAELYASERLREYKDKLKEEIKKYQILDEMFQGAIFAVIDSTDTKEPT